MCDIIKDLPVHTNYVDEVEAHNILINLKYDSLSCVSLNIQSLPSKNHEFSNLINSLNSNKSKVSCFALQETWLTSLNNNSFSYPGYKSFFKSRLPGNVRGGVGLLIDDSFTCQPLTNEFFIDNILETLSIRIKFGSFRAIVVSLYRPPSRPGEDVNTSFEHFMTFFDDFLHYLENFNEPVCIMGDFNLNLFHLNDASSHPSSVNESLLYAGFLQIISRATRVRPPAYSLIDFVCLKDLLPNLTHSLIIDSDLSDHFPILTILKLKNTKSKPKQNTCKKRIYSAQNIENFRAALSLLDWDSVTTISDTNLASTQFIQTLSTNLNTHIPLKNFRHNSRVNPINPWMTTELLVVRSDKLKLYKIAKKRGASIQSIAEYKHYRNYYYRMINNAKKDYYRRKMAEAGRDGRKIWTCMKEAMGIDSSKGRIEGLLVNNIEITDDQEMANHFNTYIGNLGLNLTPDLPSTLKDFRDYLPPPIEDDFIFSPLTPLLVKDYIIGMKPKRSLDCNDLSMVLIQSVAQEISIPLCHIFNLSFSAGIFPENQKVSKGIPIFKGGDPLSLDNFRIISIIDNFSKIQEKILYDGLFGFLDSKNLFFIRQFGFRPGHSTTHAITSLINQITNALVSGKLALGILLDIRKCFDLIDRDILFVKLENYGVRGPILRWFKSYFSNRTQRVNVNGIFSTNFVLIILGVMQGSILGVLLFIIFINDIYLSCPSILSNLFADDNIGLIIGQSVNEIIETAALELPLLVEWYSSNKLLIHPGKTRGILFTSPRFVIDLPYINQRLQFPISIDMNNHDENLPDKITPLNMVPNPDEPAYKFLGIQLDSKLNFKHHFKQLYIRVSRAIYTIKQMRLLLDKRHLKLLYSSYVKSIIEYACANFTQVSASVRVSIFNLQKRLVRIITNSPYLANTAILFRQEGILPLDQLIEYNAIKFMFEYRQGTLPPVFNNTWQFNNPDANYLLRNAADFLVRRPPAHYLSEQPYYYFPRAWNRLPNHIKIIPNKKAFLTALHQYLLTTVVH